MTIWAQRGDRLRRVKEIEELARCETALCMDDIAGAVIQGLDLGEYGERLKAVDVTGTVFLGCRLSAEVMADVIVRGAVVFPELPSDLPYHPYRSHLYSARELFDRFDLNRPRSYCECLDARVYRHWETTGGAHPGSILETLARRLHDHAITDALEESLASRSKVVAIMGGHSMTRDAPSYAAIARTSRELTRRHYFMVSGGGPGAMEATHLGAWFSDYGAADLEEALAILSQAPSYRDLRWLSQAFRVLDKFGRRSELQESLGIPTWLYGHEPPNPFATHIAKYFANSVREDGLVTIATNGIVFAPGSAGTIQEIFQDATQNHYGTVGSISPMVFFDEGYWTKEKAVYPLLQDLAAEHPYAQMLGIANTSEETVSFIETHPPRKTAQVGWSFCRAFGGAATEAG